MLVMYSRNFFNLAKWPVCLHCIYLQNALSQLAELIVGSCLDRFLFIMSVAVCCFYLFCLVFNYLLTAISHPKQISTEVTPNLKSVNKKSFNGD